MNNLKSFFGSVFILCLLSLSCNSQSINHDRLLDIADDSVTIEGHISVVNIRKLKIYLFSLLIIGLLSSTDETPFQESIRITVKRNAIDNGNTVIHTTLFSHQFFHFYFTNKFGDLLDYPLIGNSHNGADTVVYLSSPVLAHIEKNGTFHYLWLRRGRVINIKQISFTGYSVSSNDKQYNNELKFWYAYGKKFNAGPGSDLLYNNGINIKYYDSIISFAYLAKIKLLNNFIKKNTVSNEFIRFAQAQFLYLYIAELAAPFFIPDGDYERLPEWYIQKLLSFRGKFNLNPFRYSTQYCLTAWNYNKFLTEYLQKAPLSLPSEYASAEKYFSGGTLDWILFKLVKDNFKKNMPEYEKYILKYDSNKSTKYTKYLDSLANRFKSISNNDSLLNSVLIDPQGDSLSWEQILDLNKGKICYIDFWADWCVPCKREIPNSLNLLKSFSDENMEFIFISLDFKDSIWSNSLKTLFGLDKDKTQQYFLPGQFNAPLSKWIGIMSIPHYIIINQKGKVVSADAPRPGNPIAKQLLERLLKK